MPPHQQQDLGMADESQRGGELPASAAAVAVGDDAPVGLELQTLQQVRHHLDEEKKEGGVFRRSING